MLLLQINSVTGVFRNRMSNKPQHNLGEYKNHSQNNPLKISYHFKENICFNYGAQKNVRNIQCQLNIPHNLLCHITVCPEINLKGEMPSKFLHCF